MITAGLNWQTESWDEFEVKYTKLFPSDMGNVVKPLRMVLGALIIQIKLQYSDRELMEQITENPYLKYFIGLPDFREEAPYDMSTLVLFRKRISAEMLMEVNEHLLIHKDDDKDGHTLSSGAKSSDIISAKENTNKGTLTLDATCAPVNICYSQDISRLNETREKLETIIYCFINPMALSYQDDTANGSEESILLLLGAESTQQRKSTVCSADSLHI